MAEYNRYETPMARGAQWPDGSPVSNWSQAIAVLARRGAVRGIGGGPAEHASTDGDGERSRFASA